MAHDNVGAGNRTEAPMKLNWLDAVVPARIIGAIRGSEQFYTARLRRKS
jgi:hypothetical protein